MARLDLTRYSRAPARNAPTNHCGGSKLAVGRLARLPETESWPSSARSGQLVGAQRRTNCAANNSRPADRVITWPRAAPRPVGRLAEFEFDHLRRAAAARMRRAPSGHCCCAARGLFILTSACRASKQSRDISARWRREPSGGGDGGSWLNSARTIHWPAAALKSGAREGGAQIEDAPKPIIVGG